MADDVIDQRDDPTTPRSGGEGSGRRHEPDTFEYQTAALAPVES